MKTNFTSSFEVQVYEVLSCYKIALFWLFVQRFCNWVGSLWSILVSSSLPENLLRKFCKRDKNYQLNNVVEKSNNVSNVWLRLNVTNRWYKVLDTVRFSCWSSFLILYTIISGVDFIWHVFIWHLFVVFDKCWFLYNVPPWHEYHAARRPINQKLTY